VNVLPLNRRDRATSTVLAPLMLLCRAKQLSGAGMVTRDNGNRLRAEPRARALERGRQALAVRVILVSADAALRSTRTNPQARAAIAERAFLLLAGYRRDWGPDGVDAELLSEIELGMRRYRHILAEG
jgi:hypothetical protein